MDCAGKICGKVFDWVVIIATCPVAWCVHVAFAQVKVCLKHVLRCPIFAKKYLKGVKGFRGGNFNDDPMEEERYFVSEERSLSLQTSNSIPERVPKPLRL